MGLDQYISAHIYVPLKKIEDAIAGTPAIAKRLNTEGHGAVVRVQIAQFRKFNALHGYIKKRVGEIENLQEVPINDLIDEMYEDCKLILATKDSKDGNADAIQRMPPTEGFFFGSTEVDRWYYNDMKELHDLLSDLIKISEMNDSTAFSYRAWW